MAGGNGNVTAASHSMAALLRYIRTDLSEASSQEEFAEILDKIRDPRSPNITRTRIGKIENAQYVPRFDELKAYANFLNIPMWALHFCSRYQKTNLQEARASLDAVNALLTRKEDEGQQISARDLKDILGTLNQE